MNYYGVLQKEPSQLEQKNTQLARKAAREGFVLLKNDNALPIKQKTIALYGAGARKTVKGGTGSGAVQERHSVSIAQGLKNAGFSLTTEKYLNEYDELYKTTYDEWHNKIDEELASVPPLEVMGRLAILGGFSWPVPRNITKQDVNEIYAETAIYVLARQAGEGCDRSLVEGDFLLTSDEKSDLAFLAKEYKNTVLVINVGGFVDLSVMDEVEGINAVIFYGQGGMEGGNALGELLKGEHSFSGKLADTWPMKYEDVPFAMEYGKLNGDLKNENYKEDIYVGYRYYDTFNVKPRFAFGHGLSYTKFEQEIESVEIKASKVIAKVTVKNVGETYSAKEVVQAYLSFPKAKIKREKQSLVAFAKTKLLKPKESVSLELCFNLEDVAMYCEGDSAWILQAGEYILSIGNSSQNTQQCATIWVPVNICTQQCKNCCEPKAKIDTLVSEEIDNVKKEGLPSLTVDAATFTCIHNVYEEKITQETGAEEAFLNSLTTNEMMLLVRGGDLQRRSESIHGPLGAGGRTCLDLMEKGLGNVAFSDGPAGLNIVEHVIYDENGAQQVDKIPEKYNFASMKDRLGRSLVKEGTSVYRYATAWPVELLLAQTWNLDLVEEIGKGISEEMLAFGVTLWLAPGMNIHRNPLCGRNFEYFSEDPLLTGEMAAAITKGVQCNSGVGVTLKHFCCNNQEDNRTGVSSNVTERALREIYLRGFSIAVKKAKPMAVMTSYNLLNGTYTPNRYDLINDILRCEWGFEGVVMTDWGSCAQGLGNPAMCVASGNDLVMPGCDNDTKSVEEALQKGEITKKQLRSCAARVVRLVKNSAIYN